MVGAVTATVLGAANLGLVSAANATTTGVGINCDAFGNLDLTLSSITGAIAADTVVVVGAGGVSGATVALSGVTGLSTWSAASTTADRTYTISGSGPAYITFTATSGACSGKSITLSINGGSASPANSSAPEPQSLEVSLTPTDGTRCKDSSQSGIEGTWINLPAANDCTPPASKANAKLLGWATSPNFPVAIAKRQVDNGWGAYETFNDDGQLTGVFIPAGGGTFLSGSGKLYTIWSE